MTASHAAWLMNVWTGKGAPLITAEKLLPPELLEGVIKKEFETKEDWQKHKATLQRMAKWLAGIAKEVKEGKRGKRTFVDVKQKSKVKKDGD